MDMAQNTGGLYYSSPTAENLEAIFNEILETIVTHTSPYDIDIVEVTETYIVDEGSFSIAPDSMVEVDGKTEITWLNVAQHVGNHDDRLSADEIFSVSFLITKDYKKILITTRVTRTDAISDGTRASSFFHFSRIILFDLLNWYVCHSR